MSTVSEPPRTRMRHPQGVPPAMRCASCSSWKELHRRRTQDESTLLRAVSNHAGLRRQSALFSKRGKALLLQLLAGLAGLCEPAGHRHVGEQQHEERLELWRQREQGQDHRSTRVVATFSRRRNIGYPNIRTIRISASDLATIRIYRIALNHYPYLPR